MLPQSIGGSLIGMRHPTVAGYARVHAKDTTSEDSVPFRREATFPKSSQSPARALDNDAAGKVLMNFHKLSRGWLRILFRSKMALSARLFCNQWREILRESFARWKFRHLDAIRTPFFCKVVQVGWVASVQKILCTMAKISVFSPGIIRQKTCLSLSKDSIAMSSFKPGTVQPSMPQVDFRIHCTLATCVHYSQIVCPSSFPTGHV